MPRAHGMSPAGVAAYRQVLGIDELAALVTSGLSLVDDWDASGAAPTPTANGQYWIVSVDGTTDLGGIDEWFVGDWAIHKTAGVWIRVPNPAGTIYFTQSGAGAVPRTMQDKAREIEYNLIDVIPEAERAAILAGTSTYDATADMQQALTNAKTVKLPEGQITLGSTWITMRQGQSIVGAGRGKTVIKSLGAHGSRGLFYADSLSEDTADNLTGIYIADLTLDGQTDTLGYSAFQHLMGFYGVTDAVVERVEFRGFRGDGCYLGGGGVGPLAGEERHNVNVTFRDCVFDGVVKDNRNGLSGIDCDGLLVDNCWFKNIGNATLSSSVGAIDFEPNETYSRVRNVTIRKSRFSDIDSTNTAGITVWVGNQSGDGSNIRDWTVEDCTFERCYWGVVVVVPPSGGKTPTSFRDNLNVLNNRFIDSVAEDVRVDGANGYKVNGNTHMLTVPGSVSYRGGIRIGEASGGVCRNAIDGEVSGNTFRGLRPQFGCINIRGARGLKVNDNHFEDVTGACISILTSVSVGANRYLEGIVAERNSARCLFDDHSTGASSAATTGLFVNTSGIGTEFINSTCIERDNVVFGRVQKHRATALAVFREQGVTAAPTTGTWDRGNSVMASNASASGVPGWVCTTAGTFGTLTAVTADVTNGSRVVANVADPNTLLREGQYVTFVDSATAFRIEKIDGTTLYLNNTFNGTTGIGVAGAFSAPVFKAMAVLAA